MSRNTAARGAPCLERVGSRSMGLGTMPRVRDSFLATGRLVRASAAGLRVRVGIGGKAVGHDGLDLHVSIWIGL